MPDCHPIHLAIGTIAAPTLFDVGRGLPTPPSFERRAAQMACRGQPGLSASFRALRVFRGQSTRARRPCHSESSSRATA